ncbi:MAG: acetate uptake transporter [Acidimicrobiales bacterium]
MSAKQDFASPAPWAVFAFATTSFVLGFYNAHLINASAIGIVIPFALIFGGLCQMIVAVLEIVRGAGFTGTVFGTYGPLWIIYGLFVEFYAKMVLPAHLGVTIELFLLVFAVLTFFFFIASLRTDKVLVVIFFLIEVALILLALGFGGNSVRLIEAGGWVTMAFAVLAWYHAAAGLISMTWGRSVLPLGPIGPLPAPPSAES